MEVEVVEVEDEGEAGRVRLPDHNLSSKTRP